MWNLQHSQLVYHLVISWCHKNSWSWFWLWHESKDNIDADDLGVLGCYAASFGEWFPTFWRNIVSSSSGSWSPVCNSWIVWHLKTYAIHFFWNVVNHSSGDIVTSQQAWILSNTADFISCSMLLVYCKIHWSRVIWWLFLTCWLCTSLHLYNCYWYPWEYVFASGW